jgi:hypothetical protein
MLPRLVSAALRNRLAGQPAEEMERQVSIRIERAVNGMPGLARACGPSTCSACRS